MLRALFLLIGLLLLLWSTAFAADEVAAEPGADAAAAADPEASGEGEADAADTEAETAQAGEEEPLIKWYGESPHWQEGQEFSAVMKAPFIGSQECLYCHKEMKKGFLDTAHARSLADPLLALDRQGCESCHGAGGAHAVLRSRAAIFAFDWQESAQHNAICLRCHDWLTSPLEWERTAHGKAELRCTQCHDPHPDEEQSYRWLLSTQQDLGCVQCHLDVAQDFSRMSHHPVQVSMASDPGAKALHCTDCHDVHAGYGRSMLARRTASETCITCHADKGGPFRFEHLAADESMSDGCMTCHVQHGSDNAWLHSADGQQLCLRCHTEHATEHYEPLTCWTVGCHESIHGSNRNLLFLEF
ncbi:cytochrome c3 family protein [bacterium]|nr:cytochrome c3 family protein [bacterium]